MHEFDDAVLQCFLDNQEQLFRKEMWLPAWKRRMLFEGKPCGGCEFHRRSVGFL